MDLCILDLLCIRDYLEVAIGIYGIAIGNKIMETTLSMTD